MKTIQLIIAILDITFIMFIHSGQKKKVNSPEGAKYLFPVERGKLSIKGKNLFASSGPLTFFFLTTVVRELRKRLVTNAPKQTS